MNNTQLILTVTLIALVVICLTTLYYGYVVLNKLRKSINSVDQKLDTATHKRFELIPEFLAQSKNIMLDEKNELDNIKKARVKIIGAINDNEKLSAETSLSENLDLIFTKSDNYPQASKLQEIITQLKNTNKEIENIKLDYNKDVEAYNKMVKSFPFSMVAILFKFQPKEIFK